jgi:hypothetical protein
MNVERMYVKQGNRGNCGMVALRNIYTHFGVDINCTNRETTEHGYIPGGGDYSRCF